MSTDFEVRKQTLINLGGNPEGLSTIYEVDLAIEEALRNGAGGGSGSGSIVYSAGENIDITNNKISAKGYKYDDTTGSFEHYNVAHDGDASTVGDNEALGKNSVVFGQGNTISAGGEGSAIIGGQANVISGAVSTIVGGYNNNVSGSYSFAEGQGNTVTSNQAHVEGINNTVNGRASHAEGANTTAIGQASHAEGWGAAAMNNLALGDGSHVEGVTTTAQNLGEHAEGCSNVSHKASDTYGDAGNTISSIGCGANDNGVNRRNAVEVMQNGDVYIKGIGGYNGTDVKTQNIDILTLAEVIDALQPMKSVTYAELVALATEGKLVAGRKYRITDYVATTTEEGSMSANHPFDIVVTALDNNNLGTQASALPHEGDTYFANVSMSEWQIWYSIDNDTTRWGWADSTNGKGVIYRMIDEFNNDVGYDFKGIVFKRCKITGFNEDGADLANTALTKVIGKYAHESTANAYFTVDTADFKWFYLFSVFKDDVITDYSVEFMADDWQGNKQRPNQNVYTNGQYLLNGVHIVYNSGRPAERTKAGLQSRFWTCEANCGDWDCATGSQSWYATVGRQMWKALASVGFIADCGGWQAKYGTYNVYSGDYMYLDAGNNGMCWFINPTTAASKRSCKLVDGTNPYSWNSSIVKIDFPAEGYWCGKNSNGEMVYWLPADLAPTTTPTE